MRCHYLFKVSQELTEDHETVPYFVNIFSGGIELTLRTALRQAIRSPSSIYHHWRPNVTCVSLNWIPVCASEVETSKLRLV